MIPLGILAAAAGGGASVWSPGAIPTSLWIDASDASARVLSSGAFTSMLDKSGSGNHFSQAATGRRPALESGGLNGLDVAAFDGSDVMGAGSTTVGAGVSSLCVAALVRPDIVNEDRRLWNSIDGGTTTNNPVRMLIGFTAAGNWRIGGRRTDGGTYAENTAVPASAGQWAILVACFDYAGAALTVRLNGSVASTGAFLDPGTTSPTSSRGAGIGGRPDPADFFLAGKLAELVIAPALIDVAKIEGYYAHKWGLTGSLPPGHPYKASRP